MTIEEVVSLVGKAVSEHSYTKAFRIQVVPAENNTIKLMGQVHTYFQKCLVITVARQVCKDRELAISDVVVVAVE